MYSGDTNSRGKRDNKIYNIAKPYIVLSSYVLAHIIIYMPHKCNANPKFKALMAALVYIKIDVILH